MIKKAITKLFKSQFIFKILWAKLILLSLKKNSRTKPIECLTKYEQVINERQTVVMETIFWIYIFINLVQL